ncbi:HpaII family restriction endonuclease [Flavobacterium franklandianum]|nr:HpaII family restriction endonuclease [Flavobacterium franklandianum]
MTINSSIYQMIMKKFLTDYALGMRAAEVWKRDYQATGGYLIVKDDGELICYHFYFAKNFEDYLFNNTKLETASERNGFGKIYSENGQQKIKLNLQIRFIK